MQDNMKQPERLTLDSLQIAKLLGVSRSLVYQLWWRGELESVTLGTRRFSTREQVEALLRKTAKPLHSVDVN